MCSFASFALRWWITLFLVGLVACSGSGGSGSQSDVQNAPAAPAAAMASTGTNQITIAWSAVNNANAYNLYWSSTAGVTITNGTKFANVTSPYTHSGLNNGQTYHYIVTATNSRGESSPSSEVSATPALGFSWTTRVPGSGCACNGGLKGAVWSGSQFVAIGSYGVVYTSPDGVQWTLRSTNEPTFHLNDVLWTGAEYVAGGIVVVGSNQNGFPIYSPMFLTSADGITWARRTATWDGQSIVTGDATTQVTSIAWSGTSFVAIMGLGIYSSNDGIAWIYRGDAGPARVVWSNNQFLLASQQDGTLKNSPDGVTWQTKLTLGSSYDLNDIAYSGSKFAGAGVGPAWGLIARSTDLISWNILEWNSGVATKLERIMWDGAQFVAVGYLVKSFANNSTADAVLASSNGDDWTEAYLGNAFHKLLAIVSSGTRYVVVGDDGAILSSP